MPRRNKIRRRDEYEKRQDNVPVLEGTYKNSEYYYESPLGVAGNFHLFAFDSIDVGVHCNGNFAAPNVKVKHANGTNQNTSDNVIYEHEVSLATETIDIQETTPATDLLVPMNSFVTDGTGNNNVVNPVKNSDQTGQIRINGNLVNMSAKVGNAYIYHIGKALPKDYYNSAECDATKRYDGMRQVRLIFPASAFENEVLYINYYYYDTNSNQYLHGRYALKLAQNEFWTLVG